MCDLRVVTRPEATFLRPEPIALRIEIRCLRQPPFRWRSLTLLRSPGSRCVALIARARLQTLLETRQSDEMREHVSIDDPIGAEDT
jgi:hypothetical protein